jgi:hypothetical protein
MLSRACCNPTKFLGIGRLGRLVSAGRARRLRPTNVSVIVEEPLPANLTHYPTGRDLAILGLPLAAKLRGEMLVVRVRHRLWADGRCLIRGTQSQLATGIQHILPVVRA